MTTAIPTPFQDWFAMRGWEIRHYQLSMLKAFQQRRSSLLIAPTGAGKTLAGFLPSLVDIHTRGHQGLHTLYISPLKALANDIERNLLHPIDDMQLDITVESRTGDTSSYRRQRQRRKPPHLLLTTPESLMLMLSYTDAPNIFSSLQAVIIDEVHSFAHNKRGDFTTLCLARLEMYAKGFVRFGLSATVADPKALAQWLGPVDSPCQVIAVNADTPPDIEILKSDKRMPFSGYIARYAMKEIYQRLVAADTTLVFVNTRAQAELVFQLLWEENHLHLPIAIYHGSLDKDQRIKTEALMADGTLRAIVATSALELGIDWGDVDLVIQIGAPKGVSRLLQRIGRANHRLDEPSRALLVPGNRLEALECQSAIDAIARGDLDGEALLNGALDIIPQFAVNCACSAPFSPEDLYRQVTSATPYAGLARETFDALVQFARDGGYALRAYDRYRRLEARDGGQVVVASQTVARRHRQNIGTIVEAARLRVKRIRRRHQGKIIGEVEESFAQQLTPGDTFIFAGEVMVFEGVKDMIMEARPAKGGRAKVPAYVGGQMPLSTFLANDVRRLFNSPKRWRDLPADVQEWLALQKAFSTIPREHRLLVEHFPYRDQQFTVFYTFEGRKANQTLGMLITRRMEKLGLMPLSFSINDYVLSVSSLSVLNQNTINALFASDILEEDLEEWIMESPMLKRAFRHVAIVSGLIEQRYAGSRKTMKQVTFSTDLIYDVLRRYDPQHVLLKVTRQDAERELLDMERLRHLLTRFEGKLMFQALSSVSPLAIPVVLNIRRENIRGSAVETMLSDADLQQEGDAMLDDVRHALNH